MFFKSKSDDKTSGDPVVIEIFKAGRHRPMSGKEIEFTQADVEAIATAFDPSLGAVPVVIGHPKANHPAYAWAENVFVEGDILKATLKDIDPAFAEIVRAGRYKRISSALFGPDSLNNPVPGQYYLRHIGFLGAAAPAVKGLKDVELAGDEDDWLQFGDPQVEAVSAHYEEQIRAMKAEAKIEDLIKQGKVLPWAKEGLLRFTADLDDKDIIEFSEGNERTAADWFFCYLDAQMPQVPMGKLTLEDDCR